uniref:Uncharacterized protein n=1 Tax=Oryza meridionalis TaxID=40149 RepID=A0A0E0ECX3_9ORYZ
TAVFPTPFSTCPALDFRIFADCGCSASVQPVLGPARLRFVIQRNGIGRQGKKRRKKKKKKKKKKKTTRIEEQ